jgi:hypothetical protein
MREIEIESVEPPWSSHSQVKWIMSLVVLLSARESARGAFAVGELPQRALSRHGFPESRRTAAARCSPPPVLRI